MLDHYHFDYFKYLSAALILKLFSISPQFYRILANVLAAKKSTNMIKINYYKEHAKQFLSYCKKYQAITDGGKTLEIGTGWIHFESILIRLFYDVEATLFDVWDNRQLFRLKTFFGQLENILYQEMILDEVTQKRLKGLFNTIASAESFNDLYQSVGFHYAINQKGTIDFLKDESFNLVHSYNVLEHVDQKIAPELIENFYRLLKPGGVSIHSIDISDHLVSFVGATSMSKKYYLRYSNKTWKRFFENKVQYINCMQCSEWLELFQQAGLILIEKKTKLCEVNLCEVSEFYRNYAKEDLECYRLVVLHKKLL